MEHNGVNEIDLYRVNVWAVNDEMALGSAGA